MGLGNLWKMICHNGGIWRSLKAIYIRDTLKLGTLVGTDAYGNRYYENNNYFIPTNRWVEYADNVGLNYDGSQVPAEWFGWLHHRTDLPPSEEPFRPKYSWMSTHEENMTGTREQYVPYTTTRPKIIPWVPPRGDKSGMPGSDTTGKEGDTRKVCEDQTKVKESPSNCKEEEITPPMCKKEKMPPKCQTEEIAEKCDERGEKKNSTKCEKPVNAFH